MKTDYKNDLNRAYLIVEGTEGVPEDYQVAMLRENEIGGLLKTEVRYVDGVGHYYYDISGKTSLQQTYEREKLGYENIKRLIETLSQTIQNLSRYMLKGDCLLLDPEHIFCEKEQFLFCYFPQNEKELKTAFHELTEYFVREVDYRDEKGIHLAYVMHKATMEENYSIRQIMEDFLEERREKREEERTEEVSFKQYLPAPAVEEAKVEEKKNLWEPVKKFFKTLSCN